MSRSCTELTEHRFVTNLIDIFSVRIVFSQTLPNFRSLLFIVQVAMILNLADDTQRNHYRPTIVAKFVLMNVSLSDVFSEAQGKAVHHGQRAVPGWYGTYWVKGGLNPPPIERFLFRDEKCRRPFLLGAWSRFSRRKRRNTPAAPRGSGPRGWIIAKVRRMPKLAI